VWEVNGHYVHIGNQFEWSEFAGIEVEGLIGQNFNDVGGFGSDFILAFVMLITDFGGDWELSFTLNLIGSNKLSSQVSCS